MGSASPLKSTSISFLDCREEAERCRLEREAAVADLERKESDRANAARMAEDAADMAGRYKETVARLTADNMIFLMKVMLKPSHGTLIPWFFEVADLHHFAHVNAEFRFEDTAS